MKQKSAQTRPSQNVRWDVRGRYYQCLPCAPLYGDAFLLPAPGVSAQGLDELRAGWDLTHKRWLNCPYGDNSDPRYTVSQRAPAGPRPRGCLLFSHFPTLLPEFPVITSPTVDWHSHPVSESASGELNQCFSFHNQFRARPAWLHPPPWTARCLHPPSAPFPLPRAPKQWVYPGCLGLFWKLCLGCVQNWAQGSRASSASSLLYKQNECDKEVCNPP